MKLLQLGPTASRKRAAKAKGNLILKAPTGSGKTEAALLWPQLNQQSNGRLFYALDFYMDTIPDRGVTHVCKL